MFRKTFLSSIKYLKCTNILRPQNLETMIRKHRSTAWESRTPSRIVNEEIILDEHETKIEPRKYASEEERKNRAMKPRPRRPQPKKPKVDFSSGNTYKENGHPNYRRIVGVDRNFASLMMELRTRKGREKKNQIMMEGARLIADAVEAGLKPQVVLFSREHDVMKIPLPSTGVELYKVPYATLQLWSSLTTTPGIIGIFEMPESFEKEQTVDTLPITVICDNVKEPGNLGSILRAAAGVGCERVIMMKGCVDVWEPKVLRSSAGAQFRVSISRSIEWDDIETLISPNAKIFMADNSVTTKGEEDQNSSSANLQSETVDIPKPIENAKEYEFDTEISNIDDIETLISPNAKILMADNSVTTKGEEDQNASSANLQSETVDIPKPIENAKEYEFDTEISNAQENAKKLRRQKINPAVELAAQIPVMPYYDADYTTNEIVLIVGGETEGLSLESVELVQSKNGVRVNIPLTNEVESLNTGMALGIVAFEIKRQFSLVRKSLTQ